MITVTNNDISETSYICNEILEEPVYYEMSWDDYEEWLIYENNRILDFDETNAMEYDEQDTMIVNLEQQHTNDIQLNDNVLQQMYSEYKSNQILRTEMPDALKYSIELLSLLKNSNVSDALYDKIVDWLATCSDMDALSTLPKRNTAMKQLRDWYMMDDLYPEQKSCIQASIGLPIYVPVHSFVNSLFSLLVALDLMRKENLLFADMNNPAYVCPRNLDAALDDINTGNAYYDYYDKLIDPTNNVIIPLMLFADGMQIDKNGHICQEPWMFTLGIFNCAARNHPCAWRNIGLTCTQFVF